MLIRQLSRDDKVAIFITGQNVAGETLSVGVNVCYDWRNAASHGNAVIKPTTSTLGLYAGAVAHKQPNYKDLPNNSYGLIQVFGVHGSFAYNVGAASLSCAGQWQIPIDGAYSGQTTDISGKALSWTSQTYFIARGAFLLSNNLSGTGFGQAFVRAL